ncbi:EAL domain-containing protein (putative c-di-GMP-specific phosphodiesterase class I) [Nocardiopsis terrae]|uniref:EAL domain-containing protein (Putative c-di-GMP-specific phosphodiesterase class I) n=1 Tax=Nocardiopsis terrae TaxID=372655 RepID=A0ABR9HEX5_9ACTN|nr:EAL domain-containing protein [Nocardiopsis terrae]MBE1457570.1 EAL domain-containing protein (putative c-di-GMP-specific phosphodiesterase class I) [Nocardiopsis terrae]
MSTLPPHPVHQDPAPAPGPAVPAPGTPEPDPTRARTTLSYRPVVDLDSGAVVAVEVAAAPPGRRGGAEVSEREAAAVADWLLSLVREAAGAEGLLPLVLPLPAWALAAGEDFAVLAESGLRRAGRRPRDVTFMLTADLAELPRATVLSGVARLRASGFRCGFGTAMARPDLVVEAAPFLIRLDPSLVSGIDGDHRNGGIVAGLARIGRSSGVYAVAAGVTSAEEIVRLRECGVRLGGGTFFADQGWRPGERVTPVPEPAAAAQGDADSGPRVTEFMVPPVGFDSNSTAEQILEAFTGDPALNSVVLIDHRERPLGVIDRTRFLLSVTGRYGHALHAKRPALRLAEAPRTVPAWMSAIAALRVAGQDRERVYDDLIATNPYGQCLGMVHVSALIQSLSRN